MKTALKILWLKTGPLHPLDTGGKIRTYNMLRELIKRHDVTYAALSPRGTSREILDSAREYSQRQIWVPWTETPKRTLRFYAELAANLFSSLPYSIVKYRSAEMAARIRNLDDAGGQDLIVCDFLTPSINFNKPPKTPSLLFEHNVESQIWWRTAQNSRGPAHLFYNEQGRRMEKFERDSCSRMTAVTGVSHEDCLVLREKLGLKNVLGAAPTGVDVSYFAGALKGTKKPRSLVFLGSMDWMPNIDAAKFFVEEIFPLVRRGFPDASLAIVGRNPPPVVRALESTQDNVRVTGTVEDVRPWLAQSEVMIVPLRVGGGTRIKIFEGMAAGLPVVSTHIGAEGLPVTDQENILLADEPVQFARAILTLFEQDEPRRRIGENGMELVRRQFSWEAATRIFENYCFQACGK